MPLQDVLRNAVTAPIVPSAHIERVDRLWTNSQFETTMDINTVSESYTVEL